MYLDLLEPHEKIAFSRLAFTMIAFQGIEDHEEKLYFAALAEMGIAEPDLDDQIDLTLECAAFTSMASKRVALLELMLLALADGALESGERHLLDDIIEAFGFGPETVEQGWAWVKGWYQTFSVGKAFVQSGALNAAV